MIQYKNIMVDFEKSVKINNFLIRATQTVLFQKVVQISQPNHNRVTEI